MQVNKENILKKIRDTRLPKYTNADVDKFKSYVHAGYTRASICQYFNMSVNTLRIILNNSYKTQEMYMSEQVDKDLHSIIEDLGDSA
ncbi:hypothetical protein THF1D04_20301 [Vibrio owensii]|uniref:Helix-turn-helix domain-containing protein n=1 Tax=Vibrio owensii TaxID=696485 RepID=A0AAU9Q3R1_9VIBR|nr:hypothetical protein THF1D04_20301 [Vibrio owensii]